jgi:hypothetical protein
LANSDFLNLKSLLLIKLETNKDKYSLLTPLIILDLRDLEVSVLSTILSNTFAKVTFPSFQYFVKTANKVILILTLFIA